VYGRDTFWREKYGRGGGAGSGGPGVSLQSGARPELAARPDRIEGDGHVHMPSPSFWPMVSALGLIVAVVGAITSLALTVLGALVMLVALWRFALEHHREPAHEHQVGDLGVDHRKLGMWTLLGSECFLFGTLIATYLAYRGRNVIGPFPHEVFNLQLTTLSTFDLLMSSLLMVLALAAVQRGDRRQSRLWLAGTALFGLIFLGFQAWEFTGFVHEGLTLQQNLFGSTFYVLTGCHGAHVAVGVAWLVTLLVLDLRGRLGARDATKVEVAGLYWHFVDVVWIAIFTLVYLVP
jgi:heme/copper-type cytochrome/quinol oxidase subunit 3